MNEIKSTHTTEKEFPHSEILCCECIHRDIVKRAKISLLETILREPLLSLSLPSPLEIVRLQMRDHLEARFKELTSNDETV